MNPGPPFTREWFSLEFMEPVFETMWLIKDIKITQASANHRRPILCVKKIETKSRTGTCMLNNDCKPSPSVLFSTTNVASDSNILKSFEG